MGAIAVFQVLGTVWKDYANGQAAVLVVLAAAVESECVGTR